VERTLGINPGETTPDLKFSLETVNCLGCCAIGPVMVVGDVYHGKLSLDQVKLTLDSYD
jgi:NADH-quinone oxidoreductase subunit E